MFDYLEDFFDLLNGIKNSLKQNYKKIFLVFLLIFSINSVRYFYFLTTTKNIRKYERNEKLYIREFYGTNDIVNFFKDIQYKINKKQIDKKLISYREITSPELVIFIGEFEEYIENKRKNNFVYEKNYKISNFEKNSNRKTIGYNGKLLGWKDNYKGIDIYYEIVIYKKPFFSYKNRLVYVKNNKDKENLVSKQKKFSLEIRVLEEDRKLINQGKLNEINVETNDFFNENLKDYVEMVEFIIKNEG